MLGFVIAQRAAQMRAAVRQGTKQVADRRKGVYKNLRFKFSPDRRKNFRVRIFPPDDFIRQNLCRRHRGRHAPLVKAGCDVKIRKQTRIAPDIGNVVRRHAVLCRPAFTNTAAGIVGRSKRPKFCKPAAFFAGFVPAPAQKQGVAPVAKRKPVGKRRNIHCTDVLRVSQRQNIRTVLILLHEIQPVGVDKRKMRSDNHFLCKNPAVFGKCGGFVKFFDACMLQNRQILCDSGGEFQRVKLCLPR